MLCVVQAIHISSSCMRPSEAVAVIFHAFKLNAFKTNQIMIQLALINLETIIWQKVKSDSLLYVISFLIYIAKILMALQ